MGLPGDGHASKILEICEIELSMQKLIFADYLPFDA